MSRRLITRHVRLVLLLAAFIALTTPAPLTAQHAVSVAPNIQTGTDGLFPGPIRTRELRGALEAAGASADQMLASADALEAYHHAYHDLRDQLLLPVFLEWNILTWELMSRTLPPRHAWPNLQRRIHSARLQLEAIDDVLFLELGAILSETQHAPLTAFEQQRRRDALIIQVSAVPSGHHFIDPDFQRVLDDASKQDANRLRVTVTSAMESHAALSLDTVSRLKKNHPPSYIEAILLRAEELDLLTDQPRVLNETEFAPLREAMRDSLNELRFHRTQALRELNALLMRTAESIASHLDGESARRFMSRVHELRHPQFGVSVFAVHFVDRLIEQEQESGLDVLDLLTQARDQLLPLTEEAVRAADDLAGLTGPGHQAGSDAHTQLHHRLYQELRPEMVKVIGTLQEDFEAATGRPLFAPPPEVPPTEPRDDPFAAALGAERMSDLPNDAFRSLDWALPPPIRTLHATRWARLLGLSADESQQLHSMITASRAQALDQPAHQKLRQMARRMDNPFGPVEQPSENPLTAADLPDLSRARRAAITNMLAMDAAFFAELSQWLNDKELRDIVRLLEADRQRELFTTRELMATGRRRSPSQAWRTSPLMLLARIEGVPPETLHEALRAADPHIMDVALHARSFFDQRLIIAQVDDEGFLQIRGGDAIDQEAVHQRIANPLARKFAARRALRASLREALNALSEALPDSAAMDLMNRFRLEAYPFLFQSMIDIAPELYAALQSTNRSDPNHEALSDLIAAWRTESEDLNEQMIDLIEESEDEATTLAQPADDMAVRLEEFGRRMSIVFLQMMRGECDDRALLRLNAILLR